MVRFVCWPSEYRYSIHALTATLRHWPSKEQIWKHVPPSLGRDYPNTTVIIDCSEFYILKPANPPTQSQTYSSYKSYNTYKYLHGISPTGAMSRTYMVAMCQTGTWWSTVNSWITSRRVKASWLRGFSQPGVAGRKGGATLYMLCLQENVGMEKERGWMTPRSRVQEKSLNT